MELQFAESNPLFFLHTLGRPIGRPFFSCR
jgi:hypothetical protein